MTVIYNNKIGSGLDRHKQKSLKSEENFFFQNSKTVNHKQKTVFVCVSTKKIFFHDNLFF
jgi:hypothetical protein